MLSCLESIPGLTVESVLGSQVYLEVLGHWGLLEWWYDPWSSSRLSSRDRILLRCDGNTGIPFRTKQGNGTSLQVEEGKLGFFLSCGGTLGVPLEGRQVCRGIS